MRTGTRWFIPAFLVLGLLGCSGPTEPAQPTDSKTTEAQPTDMAVTSTGPDEMTASVLVDKITTPWDAAFLPDGRALVTLRDARRVVAIDADGEVTKIPAGGDGGEVPGVVESGEGGLLGIAVPESFDRNHHVYLYRSAEPGNQVVRMTLHDDRLADLKTIVTGIARSSNHDGGGLGFGPDGKLYVSTGDALQRDRSQNPDSLNGKILRLNPDGSVPDDNPFPDSDVFTLGHRNVESFGWDDRGRMWASEFGEDTWDELNLIKAGKNYGWPKVEGKSDDPKFVNPKMTWRPSAASPSGIAIESDGIYIAALRGQRLWWVPFTGDGVGEPKAYFTGRFGRLRNIVNAGDGSLWLFTDNGTNSKIIRLHTP